MRRRAATSTPAPSSSSISSTSACGESTTPWAWSVSQSTTLPLPSSPHWVPMTTTFLATVSALAQFAYEPLAAALHELAVAIGLGARGRVPRELDRDDLPAGSQLADRGGKPGVA